MEELLHLDMAEQEQLWEQRNSLNRISIRRKLEEGPEVSNKRPCLEG
jgi:hypothetical protein